MRCEVSDREVQKLQKRLGALEANSKALQKALAKEETALSLESKRIKRLLEAQTILAGIAESIQQKAHQHIAKIVTMCLRAVFGKRYKFGIKFAQRRGRTEAELHFLKNGREIDPVSGSGGGVLDVASFAIRIACLRMIRPQVRQLLILDEPFKFVSEEYLPRVRDLLERISEREGIQILMVTHLAPLKCGKLYKLPDAIEA